MVEALPAEELRRLVGKLLGEVARLRGDNAALREEIARSRGMADPAGELCAKGRRATPGRANPAEGDLVTPLCPASVTRHRFRLTEGQRRSNVVRAGAGPSHTGNLG